MDTEEKTHPTDAEKVAAAEFVLKQIVDTCKLVLEHQPGAERQTLAEIAAFAERYLARLRA